MLSWPTLSANLGLVTHLLLGAAMCYVALPEASHIAAYITRYALAVCESWYPAQRTITKDPAGGHIIIVIIGRMILLVAIVVPAAIAVAILVAAQFSIGEQILKVSRHLRWCLMTAKVCHFLFPKKSSLSIDNFAL